MRTLLTFSAGPTEKATTLLFGNVRKRSQLQDGSYRGELHPGEIFCLRVYDLELYGATRWALYIAQAVHHASEASFIPNVVPGAKILLFVKGRERVTETLEWIKALQESEDPTNVHPSRYIRQHAILNTDFNPRIPFKPIF